jgi:hypothetical protein
MDKSEKLEDEPRNTKEENLFYLNNRVFSHQGLMRQVVEFIPTLENFLRIVPYQGGDDDDDDYDDENTDVGSDDGNNFWAAMRTTTKTITWAVTRMRMRSTRAISRKSPWPLTLS